MSTRLLDRGECIDLLALATVGRVALSANALPTVLPVSFRLVRDRLVFHTGRSAPTNVVAFQADDIDPCSQEGWSVVVTGVAHEVTDPSELALMHAIVVPHWAAGDGALVALSLDLVTGCRLGTP